MVMLSSAVVFGFTVLCLVLGLSCLLSTFFVPAELGAEKRFEKRLEYVMFSVTALVAFAVMLYIS